MVLRKKKKITYLIEYLVNSKRKNNKTYDGGGLGNGTWCIFHVASDNECSSAA